MPALPAGSVEVGLSDKDVSSLKGIKKMASFVNSPSFYLYQRLLRTINRISDQLYDLFRTAYCIRLLVKTDQLEIEPCQLLA